MILLGQSVKTIGGRGQRKIRTRDFLGRRILKFHAQLLCARMGAVFSSMVRDLHVVNKIKNMKLIGGCSEFAANGPKLGVKQRDRETVMKTVLRSLGVCAVAMAMMPMAAICSAIPGGSPRYWPSAHSTRLIS